MRRPDGAATQLAEYLKLALRGAVVEGGAQRAEVMMLVDAAERDALAVDDEAAVAIEPHVADAEAGFVAVHDSAAV